MKRRDGDLADWWNALPEATRVRVIAVLGLDRPPAEGSIDDEARLELVMSLIEEAAARRMN